MKILFIMFKIDKGWVGGILTHQNNLMYEFSKMGIEVKSVYLSHAEKPTEDFCGMHTMSITEALTYIDVYNKYDAVIFSHPCPSECKENKDRLEWKEFYKRIKVRKIAIIHEPSMPYYYPWFQEMMEHVDVLACVQEKAFNRMLEYDRPAVIARHAVILGKHPMEYAHLKQNYVLSPHSFKAWKHVDFNVWGYLHSRCAKMKVTGTGYYYYYYIRGYKLLHGKKQLMKYKIGGIHWWQEALNTGMEYLGKLKDRKEVDALFKHANTVVDMSTGEFFMRMNTTSYRSINYSVLEGMQYACLPIVRKWSQVAGLTQSNAFIVEEKNYEQIGHCMDEAVFNYGKYRYMIDNNYEYLKKNFDSAKVAKDYLWLVTASKDELEAKQKEQMDMPGAVWFQRQDEFNF